MSDHDYKSTIHLPSTSFPMKANLTQREPEIMKFWDAIDLYSQQRALRKESETFVLHDGPPYSNGDIHLGHAVNKVLKDMVNKSKSMSSYDVPYVPGWDCHGLPVELNVEKKVGRAGQKVSVADFQKACREYAKSQISRQKISFKRLGVLGDWDHPYLTMDFVTEANIIRSLAKVMKNGHLERGAKPVYWCLDCHSALAEAEVEYKDKVSPAIDVAFTVIDRDELLKRFRLHSLLQGEMAIPIWTTTPWTLPANEAVCLHPHLTYVLLESKKPSHGYWIMAEALYSAAAKRYGFEDGTVIASVKGEELEGLHLQHPFYDRKVPVILGDHVTMDAGTGAVHTAPAHGQDDYVAGQKYHLPVNNPVDPEGRFYSNTPLVGGQYVNDANASVIEILKKNKKLLHVETVQHSYPHCWRHKTPLIFRATPQWFISMDKNGLRQQALKQIEEVQWIPDWGKARIAEMISQRPDWCISRQRTWLVPIALFIDKKTGEPHPQSVELLEEIAKRVEKGGVEIWQTLDPKELLGKEADQYEKSNDGLDVWFDAGVTHESVLNAREDLRFPADLYLEGSDQHRGWFQSSLLASCAMNGVAPYEAVLTHGFTIDLEGRKMSKSIGNVISPEQMIQKFGADVLRLWIASTDYRGDIMASNEIFERCVETYRRIRNTARFLLGNLHDFNPLENMIEPAKMLALDRWIVDRVALLQTEIKNAFDQYQFHLVCQKINRLCSVDLSGFYLDIIKDRQYTSQADGIPRRSAQTAIYHVLEALVRWMAPILSFTAEEIWRCMPGDRPKSVFLTTWYEELDTLSLNEPMNQTYWEEVLKIREAVQKEIEVMRAAGNIGSSLEAEVTVYADDHAYDALKRLDDELRFVLITSQAELKRLKEAPAALGPSLMEGIRVQVRASVYPKCERCWHRREDVGKDLRHPTICLRCVENLEGEGEKRKFA